MRKANFRANLINTQFNYKLPRKMGLLGSNTLDNNTFLSHGMNNIMAFSCPKGCDKL